MTDYDWPGAEGDATWTREELLAARARPPLLEPVLTGRRLYKGSVAVCAVTAKHGTRSRYVAGCRCGECKAAQSAYDRIRWLARKERAA